MPRRLAIIPARGGSKRIPGKNVKPFLGKPMIAYALEAATEAGIFDEIHVSTDNAEIRDVAGAWGHAPAFARPAELADDHTPLIPVLKAVVEEYRRRGQDFDQVVMIMACAPLIEAEDLRRACRLFEEHGGTRDVIAIAPYPVPVEWAYSRRDDGVLVPREPGAFAIRSQDLPVHYYDAGAFLVLAADRLLASEGAGSDTNWLGIPLPSVRVVDIDDQDDWHRAEALAAVLRRPPAAAERPTRQAPRKALHGLKRLGITIPLADNAHLRPLTPADVNDDYVAGLNDPRVSAFLSSKPPHTRDSCRTFVEAQERAADAIFLGLFVDGRFSGTLRLHDVADDGASCHLGLAIFRPDLWGRGLGSRMIAAASAVALDVLGVDRVDAGVAFDNVGSARAFERAGFALVPDAGLPGHLYRRRNEV